MTPCLCDPKSCGFEVRMKSHSGGKRNKLSWKAGLQLKEFLSKVPVPHLQQLNELSSWSCFSPKSVFPFCRAGTCAKISHRFAGCFFFPFLGGRHTIQNHLIIEAMFGNRNFESTILALNQSLSLPGIKRCCSHFLDILDLP